MKICIATGIYPPSIGGPATYSKLLFDKLPQFGIDVRVVTFDSVRHLPKVIRHFYFMMLVFKGAFGSDVIYAQDPVSVGLPSWFVSFVLRKKFVLKVVGDYAWEQAVLRFGLGDTLDEFVSSKRKYCIEARTLKAIESFVARRANQIVVPSQYLKGIVEKWGIKSNKIKVIYNCFNSPNIQKSKDDLRRWYDISGHIILSAGRIVPWKGFSLLIQIMPEILSKIPNAKLLIAGVGPQQDQLKNDVKRMNLEENVLFLGKLKHQQLMEYIKLSDTFVLNTSYEGFSHLLLESMSLGVPTITTCVGGNSEMISDGENGILLGHNNERGFLSSIERVLMDDDFARKLGQESRKISDNFSESKMLKSLAGLLSKL